jgi:hypothetical protein
VSGRQKIGVLVSILWMVGLPICVMIDSNRRASEFYDMCRKVEPNIGSDLSTEQQHEVLENREIYDTNGTGSDLNRWQRRYRYFVVLHVRPLVIFWAIGGIILATVRRIRRLS